MECAKDEARAVYEEEMIAFFHGSMDSVEASRNPYKVLLRFSFSPSPNCYQFVIGGLFAFP